MNNLNWISVFLLINFLNKGLTQRTSDKMYSQISGAICFRRLNATHQTGCSSSFGGSVGVLHSIKTIEDLEFVTNNPPSPPYVPILPTYFFNRTTVLKLKKSSKYISAIIVINKTEKLQSFSHELECPNQYSNIQSKESCNPHISETIWNPYGTGLLHEDLPFPIYYVADQEEIVKITNCFEKFNNFDFENQASRSLCSFQVKSFMSAVGNSKVCIRRSNYLKNLNAAKYCDPLAGKNIYATLFPRNYINQTIKSNNYKNEKYILVSCRLDTTSLFNGLGLGAMDSLISLATMVNIAQFLSKVLPEQIKSQENILFMIFNGESYDYIGSQRFVYDLNRNDFPPNTEHSINKENIKFLIDIGTMDNTNDINLYYVNEELNEVNKLLEILNGYNINYNFGFGIKTQKTYNLPPSSAHSFLRDDIKFPAIVIASNMSNKFYHSIYDDDINISYKYKNTTKDFTQLESYKMIIFNENSMQIKIRNISSMLAMGLYEILTGKVYTEENISSAVLADEFLYCFLQSAECPLFKASLPTTTVQVLPIPPSRYIGVKGSIQDAVVWMYRLMGYLLGKPEPNIKKEDCNILPYDWFVGYNGNGECRYTTQNYSLAYSPAFSVEDYDWNSGKYSTWTESRWLEVSARIFLRPSNTHEAATLASGFVVMILSFVIVFLINSKSDILFGDVLNTSPVIEPTAC